MPDIRALVRRFQKDHRDLDRSDLLELVRELWSKPVHERRVAAVVLLDAYGDLLVAADVALLERLVREAKTWALVDGLAVDVLGKLVLSHPQVERNLDRWARDDDFWVRRAALLALIKPIRRGSQFERLGRYADLMLEEKEFFIRKAIGWAFREAAKQRPEEVYSWLASRTHRVSGITIREAVKYLEPEARASLVAAYEQGRPLDVRSVE